MDDHDTIHAEGDQRTETPQAVTHTEVRRAGPGTLVFGLAMLALGIVIGLLLDGSTVARAIQQNEIKQDRFESILEGH